jgi:hypothetical protein
MVSPIRMSIEAAPTGRTRARRGWFGKMIVQMEFHVDTRIGTKTEHNTGTRWRDATEADLNVKYAPLQNLITR